MAWFIRYRDLSIYDDQLGYCIDLFRDTIRQGSARHTHTKAGDPDPVKNMGTRHSPRGVQALVTTEISNVLEVIEGPR